MKRGSHPPAQIKFPDFSRQFFLTSQHTIYHKCTKKSERCEERKFRAKCGEKLSIRIMSYKNCLEIRNKSWLTSTRQNSQNFPDPRQKIMKFPDFPEEHFSLIFPDDGNPDETAKEATLGYSGICVFIIISTHLYDVDFLSVQEDRASHKITVFLYHIYKQTEKIKIISFGAACKYISSGSRKSILEPNDVKERKKNFQHN